MRVDWSATETESRLHSAVHGMGLMVDGGWWMVDGGWLYALHAPGLGG